MSKAPKCLSCLSYCPYCPLPLGPTPLLQDQHFSDLLGSQGFSASRDRPPQTLKDLKGKQDIENALDPETAKVCSVFLWLC